MFRIFLTDPMNCLGGSKMEGEVTDLLKANFDKVCAAAKPKETAEVLWVTGVPTIAAHELLIYICPLEYSVVAKFAGVSTAALGSGHDGRTYWKQGAEIEAASEVKITMLNAKLISDIAFHECMHQKLLLEDDKLHKSHTIKDKSGRVIATHTGNGLAKEVIKHDDVISPENIAEMAAALYKKRKQWIGGFDELKTTRNRRNSGDSEWFR